MQWQFRRVLQNFDTYKRSSEYKLEIQKGDLSILKLVIHQIHIILSEPNEKIKSKILAMRFIRDIMILGKQEIVQAVQRLITTILKICSYEMESNDPNRGETYFHQHPMYLKAQSEQEKTEIQQLGSTFLILSLESILHWARWVPLDSSGKTSIYAKAFNDLVERGVRFPAEFHYYKMSDTEKFRNTYKVEFFIDSSYTASMAENSSKVINVSQSQLSKKHENPSKSNANLKNNDQTQIQNQLFEQTSLGTIGQIREYIDQLYKSKQFNSSTNKRLQQINNRLKQVYSTQFSVNKVSNNRNLKMLKNWADQYFVKYQIYKNKKIQYKEFIKIINSEQIEIGDEEDSHNYQNNKNKNIIQNQHEQLSNESDMKILKSGKKQLKLGSFSDENLKKQQFQIKTKTMQLKRQLNQKELQIIQLKQNNKRQKQEIISDYERRMQFLKGNIVKEIDNHKPLALQLEYENQHLKKKINIIEKQFATISKEDTDVQKQLQLLKMENQKLSMIINEKNDKQSKLLLKLQNQSGNSKNFKQMQKLNLNQKKLSQNIHQLQGIILEKDQRIKKTLKSLRKCQDQLQLYKSELISERNKKDHNNLNLLKKIEYLQEQNRKIKQKLHETKRTIDLKDVELMDMKQNIKRYQVKFKNMTEKNLSQTHELKTDEKLSRDISREKNNHTGIKQSQTQNRHFDNKIKHINYEDLYMQLKPFNKQSFLRLCRSSFKKKDILFKENQLQIGIISETITDNKIMFLLHLTNLADRQFQNIKIQPLAVEGSFVTSLSYQMSMNYIFCIQPQEQQKVKCVLTNNQSPYIKQRAVITISYQRNNAVFSQNIILPFVISRFLINSRSFSIPKSSKYISDELAFKYTKKMLPKPGYLKNYFENIQQRIIQKRYDMELYHKQTDLLMYVAFNFGDGESLVIESIVMREKLNQRQRYIREQILGFLEIAFRK